MKMTRWSVDLKKRLPGGASSHLLNLHLRCSNTHHLGNKCSSLSIVTIVKHVTSPVWGAATVCLLPVQKVKLIILSTESQSSLTSCSSA